MHASYRHGLKKLKVFNAEDDEINNYHDYLYWFIKDERTYPKKVISCKYGIESPYPSIQKEEKWEEEWHVLHTLCCHHCFLKCGKKKKLC
jgi:hypothetical protein